MHTEITDNNSGRVLYDADCAFCTRWARRGERWLAGRGYRFEPLSVPSAEMKLVTTTGRALGGADAVVALAREIWWAWPVWLVSRMPGIMALFRAGYRRFAAKRYCFNGGCRAR